VDTRDRWAAWLLEHRFGGDAALHERTVAQLAEFRDRVLAGARIAPGDVVLDVGCGDGLLGMGATDLVGAAGRVAFTDVSADLLRECERLAAEFGLKERCQFIQTGLPGLPSLADESFDVAMTRSVLIYVEDKRAAFATLYRVLRPGGRLSIFEPINRFTFPEPANVLWGLDVTGLEAVADKVKAGYRRYLPDDNPMQDFDERDLLAHAEAAGFTELRLDYRVDIGIEPHTVDWRTLLRVAPNPLVPPFGRILDEALTAAELSALAERAERELAGRRRRLATAYLTATR
jgi:arsenite methyltransferase